MATSSPVRLSLRAWACIVLVACVCGLFGAAMGALLMMPSARIWIASKFRGLTPQTMQGSSASSSTADQPMALPEDSQTEAVVKNVQPSVVSIIEKQDLSKERGHLIDPFFGDETMPAPGTKEDVGGGSGFFVSSDGLIVTNRHVVQDTNADYSVILQDGRTLLARVVARDPVLDVAVVRVDGKGYPAVTFADSDQLNVGQTVVAIGNALDQFRNTVTKGIVSGLNRRIVAEDDTNSQLLEHVIQTDAAINPGNSGGPLVDLHGRVVGMNTAVSLSGQLLGFALPSNTIGHDVDLVQKSGKITRPFLGVRYLSIDPDVARENQLQVDHGVWISRGDLPGEVAIVAGSAAEKAGLKEDDIIVSVNGTAIDDDHSLISLIDQYAPGDTVTLHVIRGKKESDISATLQEYKTPS